MVTSAKRLAFAKAIETFRKTYGFDGVDIDWEFSELTLCSFLSVVTDPRRQSAVKARARTKFAPQTPQASSSSSLSYAQPLARVF
jgi:GH18 family chitinase